MVSQSKEIDDEQRLIEFMATVQIVVPKQNPLNNDRWGHVYSNPNHSNQNMGSYQTTTPPMKYDFQHRPHFKHHHASSSYPTTNNFHSRYPSAGQFDLKGFNTSRAPPEMEMRLSFDTLGFSDVSPVPSTPSSPSATSTTSESSSYFMSRTPSPSPSPSPTAFTPITPGRASPPRYPSTNHAGNLFAASFHPHQSPSQLQSPFQLVRFPGHLTLAHPLPRYSLTPFYRTPSLPSLLRLHLNDSDLEIDMPVLLSKRLHHLLHFRNRSSFIRILMFN